MNRIDNSAEEFPFCIACRHGLPDVLHFYLDKGHEPNLSIKIRNREDVGTREISPLALSVVYHFFEAALLLLERGADPDGLPPYGNSKRVTPLA